MVTDMTILSAAVLLFLVMDPLGNVPIFLGVLKNVEQEKRTKIIIRELIISLILLMLFLFLGKYIMQMLQLTEPSLSISGGIILFIIALKMIFPPRADGGGYDLERDPLIVPLAIPLIAGPSALATILLLATRDPQRIFDWAFALFLAWAVTVFVLISSNFFGRVLGRKGLTAMERLMGMILTAISVEMFLKGVKQFMEI